MCAQVRELLHKRIREMYLNPQFGTDVLKPLNIEALIDQQVRGSPSCCTPASTRSILEGFQSRLLQLLQTSHCHWSLECCSLLLGASMLVLHSRCHLAVDDTEVLRITLMCCHVATAGDQPEWRGAAARGHHSGAGHACRHLPY